MAIQKKISPLTRMSGFLELEVQIEGHTIIEAKSSSLLFRGFELMLQGRDPLDAIYFTQRICGICSTAHSVASSLALEEALQVTVTEQGRTLRDLVHSCEFLQNHLRHFYLYTLPDFIKLPQKQCLYENSRDYRFPPKINELLVANYFQAFEISRLAHEMIAIFGGKAPHDHGIFVGGLTVHPTIDKISKFRSLLKKIKSFALEKMLHDVYTLAHYYEDYFQMGQGPGHLLSFGLFADYPEQKPHYVEEAFLPYKGEKKQVDKQKITESLTYAWYEGKVEVPMEGKTIPDLEKEKAYSWSKAPRYQGYPCEVGPLARLIISGQYPNQISMMDRTIARVLEVLQIIIVMEKLLDKVELNRAPQEVYPIPSRSKGIGLTDTTRGTLGHWLTIREAMLSHYQVITPSAWNLSPQDERGKRGPVEEALIGTRIENLDHPVEIGRIVRSFDPCISCATHVYSAKGRKRMTIL
ncbi:nickel-dependent hydrogenase large subunit [Heliorestis acidaminivorans]|uniref:Nickel-dependent hydrogenase large subunit n=1 Tax=Heliorestis acidaminivorans TaxID=553427 RepID=A0A6I0ETZ9_9FIRM|nr:nickel-dependent hydrogenase large subunit [Heliorestis acidaminivorans]KAB2952650.1 nickel-dependent hydrogenase large subunit [Heliorestis acidaminivorans]